MFSIITCRLGRAVTFFFSSGCLALSLTVRSLELLALNWWAPDLRRDRHSLVVENERSRSHHPRLLGPATGQH